MIEKTINSEFGSYNAKFNCGYMVHSYIDSIDAYIEPDGDWLSCPCCGLKPKVWSFSNGRSTSCGCWNTRYDHFSIQAESIMSVHTRCDGSIVEYDSDALRKNWNEYCQTGIPTCIHGDLRIEGKW